MIKDTLPSYIISPHIPDIAIKIGKTSLRPSGALVQVYHDQRRVDMSGQQQSINIDDIPIEQLAQVRLLKPVTH